MNTGTVKFFNEVKGFGFIKADNGQEYFFHISEVQSDQQPAENDKVTFDIGEGRKGPDARNVQFA